MASKYKTRIDLNNRNNAHTLTVELIGHDKRVLDVGTATGYVAEALVGRGCRVTGIELDPEAAFKAAQYCERVIVGDVESLDLDVELGEESFDVITFGDVLEHLKNPLRVLQRFKPFLRNYGYVVVSVPNIAHGSVRLALMQGKFQYRPLGLLDDTHLRFFTRETVEQLFNDAGFSVGELERTRLGIFDTEIEVNREAVTQELLRIVRDDPEAETYQFVLLGYPLNALTDGSVQPEEARPFPEQIAQRDRLIYELDRKVRHLGELQRRLGDREERLAQREEEVSNLMRSLADRNKELARHLRLRGSAR
jgi:2-polyprenyl-3-methyl-5-hydroxy-6-metoxy-1,4-benzoquinol methylase